MLFICGNRIKNLRVVSQLKNKLACILVNRKLAFGRQNMQSFFHQFGRFYRFVCVVILAVMVMIVFVNAFMRYFMHSGFVATEEILRYLFIYLTFLGMVEVAHERGHIAVTILTDALPRKLRTMIHIVGYVLCIYALYVLIDGSIMYFEESGTSRGQVTGLPFQYIIAVLIFGAAGVLAFVIRDLVLAVRALKNGEDFPPKYVDEDMKAVLEANKAEETK